MAFTAMADNDQGTGCGGYTYELEYVSGPLSVPVDLSHYSITTATGPAVEGTLTTLGWSGLTHTLRL